MTTPLEIIKCEKELTERPRICDLDYNTWVTDVPSGKDCIYVKIKKKSRREGHCGSRNKGFGIEWDPGHCVLMNLSWGTLRQIPAKTRVQPVRPQHIKVRELKPSEWEQVKKEYARGGCDHD